MRDKQIVIYDAETREIIAVIPLSDGDAILRDGVSFIIADADAPIYADAGDGTVRLKGNGG